MKPLKTLLSVIAILAAVTNLSGQTITFEDVQTHNSGLYPAYFYTQQGNPVQGPYTWPFTIFHFEVKNATGTAIPLNGQKFIGFCVNTMFPDPENNQTSNFATGPADLSYNLGTGDYWDTDRNIKWDAIRNTLAYYAYDLRNLDYNTQDYADLVTGINIAFTEIIVDYDGTLGSIDINAGNSTAWLNDQGAPITSGAAFSTYNYIRDNLIGQGNGGAFEVFASSQTGDVLQDLAFISAVPEPSSAILLIFGIGIVVIGFRSSQQRG